MTATATPPVATDSRGAHRSAVLALAAFEGRKMLTHRLVWIGAVASVGLAVFELVEELPVLNRVSMTLAWTMAPLAASVALISGWAVLRARARTDAHPPAVSPIAMHQRVLGILLGLVYPAAATFIVQIGLLGWVMTQDPVTSMVWTEMLVGPAYVLFAGVFAAALTRWLPHAATPLFALLGLGVIQAAVPYNSEQWGEQIGLTALAPIAWPETIIPYEVSFRPSGLHLVYLVALVASLGALAASSRRILSWAVLATGIGAAVVFGIAQVGPVDVLAREAAINQLVGETANLSCETQEGIRFCAMPGYEGWIDDWADAVEPVVETTPVSTGTIEVRQYPVHNTFLLERDTAQETEWWWVEPASRDYLSRDVVPIGSVLADWTSSDVVLGVANRVIGCEVECRGDSQNVVLMWLLSSDSHIREYIEYDASPASDFATVTTCMLVQLFEQPDAQQLIRDNWETLTAPETSYQEAGEILGVSVPSGYDDLGYLEGGCP